MFLLFPLSGELRRLRDLVVDAKQYSIGVLSALVKRMLDRNMFLFGSVDISEGSITERVNEITKLQNMGIRIAHERCLANSIYFICLGFFLFRRENFFNSYCLLFNQAGYLQILGLRSVCIWTL